jgi:hypothetical protein
MAVWRTMARASARRKEQAARDARLAEERAELEAQFQKWREEDALWADLRAHFLQTPGSTEEAFSAAWPEMLKRHRIEKTLSGERLMDRTTRDRKVRRGLRWPGGRRFAIGLVVRSTSGS